MNDDDVSTSSLLTPLPLSFTVTGNSFSAPFSFSSSLASLASLASSLARSAMASSQPGGRSSSGWSDVPVPLLLLPPTSVLGQCSYTGEWPLKLPEAPEVDLLRRGLPEMLPEANSFPGLLVGLEGTVLPLVGPGMTVSDWLLLGLVTVTLTGLLTGLG